MIDMVVIRRGERGRARVVGTQVGLVHSVARVGGGKGVSDG